MTEQEKHQINEDRREHRERLLEMLKEAGLVMGVQSSDSHCLVISDEVAVMHSQDKTQVVITGDGKEIDVSDAIAEVVVRFSPRNYPVYELRFRRKALLHGPPKQQRPESKSTGFVQTGHSPEFDLMKQKLGHILG